jgi:hypothetical protein
MRTDWRRYGGSINGCRLALKLRHTRDERTVNEIKTAAGVNGQPLCRRLFGSLIA